jgi:hypothetical protein
VRFPAEANAWVWPHFSLMCPTPASWLLNFILLTLADFTFRDQQFVLVVRNCDGSLHLALLAHAWFGA